MSNEKTPAWIESKKKELKARIKKLGEELVLVSREVQRTAPRKVIVGFRMEIEPRPSHIRELHKANEQKMITLRKKIYKLEAELKAL